MKWVVLNGWQNRENGFDAVKYVLNYGIKTTMNRMVCTCILKEIKSDRKNRNILDNIVRNRCLSSMPKMY